MILVTIEIKEELLRDIERETATKVRNSRISELSPEEQNEVEIILSYGNYNDIITEEDLTRLPNLKWIQLLSSGIDQLPLEKIKEKNVKLTTARGIHGIPISEHVFASLLYFTKKIPEYNRLKQLKEWKNEGTYELYGKLIGILGTGIIGREIANKAQAFGMIPYGVNRSGSQLEEFEEIYRINELEKYINNFDIIVSALPSTKETIHLVDKALIDKMKEGVIFVNVGRGDSVVEDDLHRAILNNKFKGVALDVFQEEPLPKESPLWELEDVIITPHVSSSTKMYLPRALDLFFDYFSKYNQS